MTPRILNLQARPLGATEPCAPDVRYISLDDDTLVAFDTNTLVAVVISRAQYNALMAPHEAPPNPPRLPVSEPARLLFSGVRPKFDLSPDVSCRQLTLHLSDQCNQRCKYCWIARGENDSARPVMTPQIAAAALEMFPRDGRDLNIAFFGGEPLMQFDHIVDITTMVERRAAENKARARFHVTTNATLVTPLVAQFLADHGFSIIVSCDGPEKLHDEARGAGSHAAVLRGLKMLHDAGCSSRVVLRGTWTELPAEILARLAALNELCDRGLAAGVALEPAAGASYGGTLDAELRAACAWFADRVRANKAAEAGKPARWKYLEKTLRRILWQQFRASECGAGRGYYAVGPTGTIYACHKQQNAEIGCILQGNASIDEAKRAKWLDNRFCARRECGLCWARHVCGGACRSESLEFCGSVVAPHAGRCMLMRSLVAESLRLAAKLPREALLRICPAPGREGTADKTVPRAQPHDARGSVAARAREVATCC